MKLYLPLIALAGLSAATTADAAMVISVDSGNLAAFSYTIDEDTRTIDIVETWGANTLSNVVLKFEGFAFSRKSWIINKSVVNETGDDWNSFSHELLQSDLSGSEDNDSLSFAQFGSPERPRASDVFADVTVDEVENRDYLLFTDGLVDGDGGVVNFTYGLSNFYDTGNNNPFYLRQAESLSGVVPEPATWAMLIAGFGLVGVSVRRRRSLASVSA